tara:strand:- start:278 stop:757 length:480 start_codon:yes stop_codon:yes gene_type:complete
MATNSADRVKFHSVYGTQRFKNNTIHEGTVETDGTLEVLGNSTLTAGLTLGTQTVGAAGSDQAGAGAISATGGAIVFVTGADDAKGVRLPLLADVSIGQVIIICNNLSNKTLEVYPGSGDAVNVSSDDTAITLAADTINLFIKMDAAEWFGAELPPIAA